MRLFIAINFDDNIMEALADLQRGLAECGMTGNFTRPENLHLTLAFIGEYGNPDDILDVMEAVPFTSFPLKLESVQSYRDMYFSGISENVALQSYVRRLRRALADNGIPFDRKKFSPHITLIRKASFRGDHPRLPEVLPEDEMTVRRISLMRSERGKRSMIYTEIGGIGDD